jgi:hypothetical protein
VFGKGRFSSVGDGLLFGNTVGWFACPTSDMACAEGIPSLVSPHFMGVVCLSDSHFRVGRCVGRGTSRFRLGSDTGSR